MNTSIKNLSETQIEVTINLDAKALADARKVSVARLAKDVKVAGFRKGKAPATSVEKNIDEKSFSPRQKEVLKIYLERNRANKHKMEAIPVCKIPAELF